MTSTERKYLELSRVSYRRLIRLYPKPFLDRFGDELSQTFGDLSRRAMRSGGKLRLLLLWTRMLPDILKSAAREHLQSGVSISISPLRRRWILACGLGFLLGRFCADMMRSPIVHLENYVIDSWIVGVLCMGVALGWMQARALRRSGMQTFQWILATALGATVFSRLFLSWSSGIHFMHSLQPLGVLLVALLTGLGLGLSQFVLMRKHLANAWTWIPANMLGYAVGSCAALGILQLGINSGWIAPLTVFVTGAGLGYLTSFLLDQNTQFSESAREPL